MTLFTKNTILVCTIGLVVFVVDRIGKIISISLSDEPKEIIESFFYIGHYPNDGIGFGIPLPNLPIMIILVFILVGFVFWLIRAIRMRQVILIWGVAFILVGALSNFIDRVIYGYVIDYINLFDWSIFNLADIMVFTGVAVILVFWKIRSTSLQKSASKLK